MNKTVRYSYNVVRSIVVTAIVAIVAVYALLYILLSVPVVQNRIKGVVEHELSDTLKTHVTIGSLTIKPFNQVILEAVNIPDQQHKPLFHVDKLAAGISMKSLIADRRIVITYGEIIGLHGHITRPDPDSPTNMQFIIDAFKPKVKRKPTQFDLEIHNIVMRKSYITYDVLNKPRKRTFDVNHLAVGDLRADIDIPQLKNNDFLIDIKRMSLNEGSGLKIKNFATRLAITGKQTVISNIQIELPGTLLEPNDQVINYDSLKHVLLYAKRQPLNLSLRHSHITPSDFACFMPALSQFNTPLLVTATVNGYPDDLHVPVLNVKSHNSRITLDLACDLKNLTHPHALAFNLPHFNVQAQASEIAKITSTLVKLKPEPQRIISALGNLSLTGTARGNVSNVFFKGDVVSSLGPVKIDGTCTRSKGAIDARGRIETPRLDVGTLLNKKNMWGELAINANVAINLSHGKLQRGSVKGGVPYVDFKGYRYRNILADVRATANSYEGSFSIDDPNGKLNLNGKAILAGRNTSIDAVVTARQVNLQRMRLVPGRDNVFSFDGRASFVGNSLDNATGGLSISNISYRAANGKTYHLNNLDLMANNSARPQVVELNSDFMHGSVEGQFDFATLLPSIKGMLSKALPGLFGQYAKYATARSRNMFRFNFELEPNSEFQALVNLPVKIIYKVIIDGNLSIPDNVLNVTVNAPYLQQGNKLIEGTSLTASYDNEGNDVIVNAHTLYPSKDGKIAINVDALAARNRIDTDLGWRYNREHDYHGDIKTTTTLSRGEGNGVVAHVVVTPSDVVVNDTVWKVGQGSLDIAHRAVVVDSIHAGRGEQFINIKGKVSKNPADELALSIKDIDLDYIFETLNISNVQFGGRATGTFLASNLFTGAPRLETPDLKVKNIKYNGALMGDADIESHWDNENQSVAINADISQHNGLHSLINGAIFPKQDSLYFDFNAHKANVEFMKPFMSAFTSDVRGQVSGHAVLLGNFHTIDLYGDIYADDIKFKLDFSNVVYSCSDSVHMTPGNIRFSNVKIHDRDNHEATMSGWVKHDHFHNPTFNFAITGARDLLCYDTNASINPVWYGTVYGNGSAFVTGEPGTVSVKVNMESAPRSKFTFVLSDSEEAQAYNFITYRDRDQLNHPVDTASEQPADTVPDIVKLLTQKIAQEQKPSLPTEYKIDLQGDITPDLQMVLVMDPVSGDKIKATGRGNLRMAYDNSDQQLEMYGKYVLEKGSYNFTLQDIIIKDFTIQSGSAISFQGDPYKAILDIKAYYALNANIKDLDESFADDRELNRTNVPVHAVLMAKGVISQPDISFSLEFPTLTTEAVRKINSIISTDDMMNRQIVYLLALNRFYTPEYMNNSTTNNELTSVASSTISSQLGNMLGRLNENWSISPNFRSNKGDFSDMEVDLALSSQLLNNRLLFNGNFGYRDNAYNAKNSNFIGDFDIEYLLNSKGTFRLKAYNHYNDQNYYVRNALTTQGVGIVYKHDFDNWRNFFKRRPSVVPDTLHVPVRTAPSVKSDSSKLQR